MTEEIAQIPRQIIPEQPRRREKLSDEEIGNLVSAVGNHEAKAITLILMRNGTIYDSGNLHREILNAQGGNNGWRMGETTPFAYYVKSLAPIGLVAMEILNQDLSTYGYAITGDGKELGIPLAGLLLDFSERYNIPLNLLFGATLSSSKSKTIQTKEGKDIEFKKRSPSTTLKILYELLTSPSFPIREADLREEVEDDSSHLGHLIRLSKLGLIQYNAIEVNKPFVFYKLTNAIPEGDFPIYGKQSKFTKSVFDVLKNHPDQYLTTEDIYNLLPKEQKEKWKNEKTSRSNISKILYFLAKHKYLDIEKFSNLKKSEINITDEQRIVLTEFLEIMYRFQNQDKEILEKGKKLAGEIISDPQRVSNLLRRAKEASSAANKSPREETLEHVLSIILSNPNGLTNKEIQKLLEERYDKRLIYRGVRLLCFFLIEDGSIRVQKKGNVNIFYPNNEEQVTV